MTRWPKARSEMASTALAVGGVVLGTVLFGFGISVHVIHGHTRPEVCLPLLFSGVCTWGAALGWGVVSLGRPDPASMNAR